MGVNGIYGLSGSGMDIESMVKVGMISRQNQYDKMQKKEIKNEWLKQGYNEIYNSLNTFKYSTLSDYKMQSNMSAMQAKSSNESAVSVSANGAAVAMTHNVEVQELSTNAYLLSTEDRIARDGDSYTYNDEIYVGLKKESDNTYTLTKEDGTQVTGLAESDFTTNKSNSIYLKDVLLANMKDNGTNNGVHSLKIMDAEGNETTVNGSDVALSFIVNDDNDTMSDSEKHAQTISYTYDDLFNGKTLNDLAADIKNLGLNVTASYDSVNDSFSIYNSQSGSDATVSLTMTDADGNSGGLASKLFNHLSLGQSASGTLGSAINFTDGNESSVAGSEGKVKIDGRVYNDVKDNRITVSGVTYTLLNKTESAATVSVSQDTDTIINNVKKFVEDYNKILDDLQEKYNEKPEDDYEPLSKTQEASMTQEQIEKWNEKAKKGLFYHSDILRGIITSMRESVSTPVQSVDSQYNSASAIGITTKGNQGHLELDTDKLKKALAADPDCVYQIFASDQDTYSTTDVNKRQSYMKKDDFNNTGIANRLYYTSMTDGISKIQDYAGYSGDSDDQSTLGLLLTNLKNKMTDFKNMMDDYQTLLYKRYDAMESMIASLSSQYNTIFGSNG